MTKVININDRGTLTLPKEMRRRLGVSNGTQVVAEETSEGILLRPGVTFPLEMYSDERLAEFRRSNEEALAKLKFKKKRESFWTRTFFFRRPCRTAGCGRFWTRCLNRRIV